MGPRPAAYAVAKYGLTGSSALGCQHVLLWLLTFLNSFTLLWKEADDVYQAGNIQYTASVARPERVHSGGSKLRDSS